MNAGYFQTLAAYNSWANFRLYDAVGRLAPGEFEKKRPAFFGSIKGGLNHILVGDRIWLGRMLGKDSGLRALDGILFDDFVSLRAARVAEDRRIEDFLATIDDTVLRGSLTHTTIVQPTTLVTPWPFVLGHFFNHQTHHRGQVHDMLSQTEVAPPPLDLLYFIRVRENG
jgi:uncharacterized damage-inducible protein DinB